MLAARTLPKAASVSGRPCIASALPTIRNSRRAVLAKALDDSNIVISLLSSASAATVVAGVTIATNERRDEELAKLQELDTWTIAPIGGAIVADAIAHSLPGLNVLLGLLAEPLGAAAGVAYMMTLVLSAQKVDPKTLAPEGTILNAQKATDSRASLRVPFTQIIPTALKVVDLKNEASSGAGWTIGENGLPKLPINSVLIVLGVGGVILEAISHAPVLSAFMPRVLQVAAWLAASGYAIDYFGLDKKTAA